MKTAKPKLVVTEENNGFGIAWYFPEEEDIGGRIGEWIHTSDDLVAVEEEIRQAAKTGSVDDELFEKRENIVVAIAASTTRNVQARTFGYLWESRSDANAALRLINGAIKNLSRDVPWPDWATQAAAAGWKPPKNWKP